MKSKSKFVKILLYIAIPIAILAIIVIKLSNNKEIAENRIYRYDKEKPISVKTMIVKSEIINTTDNFTGTFEPNKESKISSEIQGKINKIFVDNGDFVRKGNAIVQLDNSLLKLQLKNIEVQIEGLENDVKRYTILTKADAIQGVQLEKTELALKSSQVQRSTLLEQIEKSTIRAAFDGVVTQKFNEEGGFAAPGMPLIQITDISQLRFTVNIPENNLKLFHLNKDYELIADSYPENKLIGRVVLIGSKANMGNSFPVQFKTNNTKNLEIKSGMFGKVNIQNTISEEGIMIPSSAVSTNGDRSQVYIVKNGKAVLKDITISRTINNNVLVSSGLEQNDELITNGFINLFENANVIVQN